MNPRGAAALDRWLPAAACALLAACHANSTRAPAPETPPPKPQVSLDGSYDWHVLLIAPFGSTLKEIPIRLHEVLLFRDEAPGGARADDAECYAPDEAVPRFAGRMPDEYLLCFRQDRLVRIQASVRLATAQAPELFAAACGGWLQRAAAAAPGPSAGAASAAATPATAATRDSCEGREDATRFSAHLGEEPDSNLSIVLDGVPGP